MGRPHHPTVVVASRAFRVARAAHPWVFLDDVVDSGHAVAGDLVRVVDTKEVDRGWAFFSQHSKITLRRILGAQDAPDQAFWDRSVDRALEWRRRFDSELAATRLIFGEADGFPGLVVDRYRDHLVVQCLTAAAERLLPSVLARLESAFEVRSVLLRNDAAVRVLEGLDREIRQQFGVTPESIEIQEDGIFLEISPWTGQKTGAFLDQRENRRAAATYARGRVLDLFCYDGGFALHAARMAQEVVGVDSSRAALDRALRNAARNRLANLSFVGANVFEALREFERDGQCFDTVFLDPPALAKRQADRVSARRAYKDLNLRAMRLLPEGGILVSSSCSYHLEEEALLAVVAEAARDARRSVIVVERRSQARDHPVLLSFPESHYLKCLVLRVI